VHFLNGQAKDLDEECVEYERLIDSVGGIDLQLLGVGANGHIGFNEPARALHTRTHRAELKRATRRANTGLFGGRLRTVPREALSMGMATILEASSIVLVAMGRAKANAVRSLFTGRISTASPVSCLQLHPDVHVIVDRAAGSSLPRLLRGLSPGPPVSVEVL
jgi:glucosamine-6-phosphate deaminase